MFVDKKNGDLELILAERKSNLVTWNSELKLNHLFSGSKFS